MRKVYLMGSDLSRNIFPIILAAMAVQKKYLITHLTTMNYEQPLAARYQFTKTASTSYTFLSTYKTPQKTTGEGGIRTRGTGVYPYDGLANRCLKPLGHLSNSLLYINLQYFRLPEKPAPTNAIRNLTLKSPHCKKINRSSGFCACFD